MTSVKSKLATSVRAAKSQIGGKSASAAAPDHATMNKAGRKTPKPPAPALVTASVTAPDDHANSLFPSRVWPD